MRSDKKSRRKIFLVWGICLFVIVFLVGCGEQETIGNYDVTQEDVEENDARKEGGSGVGQSVGKPFIYTFQPHVISKEYLTVYGPEIENEFYDFCDAVRNGEETIRCESDTQWKSVLSVSRNCFPLASQFIDVERSYVENGVAHICYNVTLEELREKVSEFEDKVVGVIKSAISEQPDEEFILAMQLLTAVANKDHYDEEGQDLDNALTWKPYRAIMEDTGICQEIAGEYIYYLLQVGINATTCSGLSADQSFAHEWVVVELDGEHYHIDPTFTIDYKDSLAFFCLNDEMREQYGEMPRTGYTYAESDKIHYEINSGRFKGLWNAESYEIDAKDRKIRMKEFYSGDEKDFEY